MINYSLTLHRLYVTVVRTLEGLEDIRHVLVREKQLRIKYRWQKITLLTFVGNGGPFMGQMDVCVWPYIMKVIHIYFHPQIYEISLAMSYYGI